MDIKEKIKQRRSQMLIHSYLYYKLNTSIVSDYTYDGWAKELVYLHKECYYINFYDDVFKDWDGSTGYHLPYDSWVIGQATRILKYHNEH